MRSRECRESELGSIQEYERDSIAPPKAQRVQRRTVDVNAEVANAIVRQGARPSIDARATLAPRPPTPPPRRSVGMAGQKVGKKGRIASATSLPTCVR